ncbi:cell division protein FtsK [Psychrobacillus lasiicapitis]|uniref:Cell division protein FtsK n=2 Tax=Psychrobacillus lasiicapitis TaxID=1636719 RepID=A0A544TF61_9BACI|nr:cell division protein FtsK [Psychrobacillus lasiicapitis]GGA15784.1 DNA translocase FtsK [Psychrobacillus lasiicapitis]
MAQQKRKPAKKAAPKKKSMHPLMFEIIGLLIIGLAIIAFFEYGLVGRGLAYMGYFLFGNWHIAIPFMFIVYALIIMMKQNFPAWNHRLLLGSGFILSSLLLFSHLALFQQLFEGKGLMTNSVLRESYRVLVESGGITNQTSSLGGGIIGAILFASFHVLFDSAGARIAGWLLLLIGIILWSDKALVPLAVELVPKVREKLLNRKKKKKPAPAKKTSRRSKKEQVQEEAVTVHEEILKIRDQEEVEQVTAPIISAFTERIVRKEEKVEPPEEVTEPIEINMDAEELENEDYQLPPITLLDAPEHNDQSGELNALHANAQKLEKTFLSFGVKAKVTEVHLGPAVTKYEVLPDVGVKVSRIVSLHDDLALALAARDIRIEAPIPGKSAIGIEVPNTEVAIVSLREVLESEENNKPNLKLLIGFGRDVTGQAVLAQLNKMPHLLVAGSTGSGKSVCINGIITSIMMRAKPHEVKMMMIDPKMVELNVYNGIPHLLAPVVTDPRKASQALKKIVSEMERRYDLFSHTGTRNMEGYNDYIDKWNEENEEKHPKLPYIVVIVDELADLMMVASSDVEDSITRLAQMARAAGIHLIIATQRPSVDVITGIIKANIPSRIAFAVSSAIDSRTILDMGGAEKLLGRGDMLFLPAGSSKPVRVQGAYLSDAEVERMVDFVIEQQKANYQEEMIPDEVEESHEQVDRDELYDEAAQLVTEMQTASVSLIQRRFRVGYSRAARIIDQLEMGGIVGPYEGSKPRQVLISKNALDQDTI